MAWRAAKGKEIEWRILAPLLVGAVAASLAVVLGGVNPTLGGAMTYAPAISIGLTVFAGASVLMVLRRAVLSASRRRGFFAPSLRQRLGAGISHLAVVILFVGFTGAGYKAEEHATMTPGDRMKVADYTVRLVGLRWDSNFEREALFADLEVTDPGGGVLGVFSPASFSYHSHPGRPTSEVAIDSSLGADVFLVLGEIDEERGAAVIRAVINPLVAWIWVGGALLVLGVAVAVFRPGSFVAILEMGPRFRRALLKPAAVTLLALLVTVPSALLDGAAFAVAMLGGIVLLVLVYFVGDGLRTLLGREGGEA